MIKGTVLYIDGTWARHLSSPKQRQKILNGGGEWQVTDEFIIATNPSFWVVFLTRTPFGIWAGILFCAVGLSHTLGQLNPPSPRDEMPIALESFDNKIKCHQASTPTVGDRSI